jgi:hypothetical protein
MKSLYLKGDRDTWRVVGERWRPLGEIFPSGVPERGAETLIAGSESVTSPAVPSAPEVWTEETPAASETTDAAQPELAVAELSTRTADADPTITDDESTAASAAVEPVPEAVRTETTAKSSADIAVPEAAASREPGRVAGQVSPVAELVVPRVARGAFRVIAPHASDTNDSTVTIAAQMLSATPAITRTGTLVISSTSGRADARQISRDRFTVRQGRDVLAKLASAELPATLTILVLDETGRVLLDQDIRVTRRERQ